VVISHVLETARVSRGDKRGDAVLIDRVLARAERARPAARALAEPGATRPSDRHFHRARPAFSIAGDRIAAITRFDTTLFAQFGLPRTIPTG
jgi:hypothetical protein